MEVTGMVFALILGIYSIVKGIKWKESNWVKRVFIIIGLLAAILVFYNQLTVWNKNKLIAKINATFGDIVDVKNAEIPILRVAAKTDFKLTNGVFGFIEGAWLKLYIKEKKLFVNVIIRDLNGKAIAVIDENTWTVFDNDFEYNNNDQAFELVSKGDRKVYFQVYLKDGVAYMQGMLVNDHGRGLYFVENKDTKTGGAIMLQIFPNEYFDLENNSAIPIFKYPRGKYLGILRK